MLVKWLVKATDKIYYHQTTQVGLKSIFVGELRSKNAYVWSRNQLAYASNNNALGRAQGMNESIRVGAY